MEAWREELYHHGILGMKWGARNGPPYPLGASDHSASEKKAGWRKSLSKSVHDYKVKKKRQKAAAKARATRKKNEEEAKKREKNLRDPLWLKKHSGELTSEELKKARDRLQLENDLRQQSIRKINAGKEYADMLLGYAKTGVDAYDTITNIKNKASDAKKKSDEKSKEAGYKKEAKSMSIDELKKFNERYDLEKEYVDRKLGRQTGSKKKNNKK